MKQHYWLNLVDDFNNGDTDFILDNFGDLNTFFDILKKKDLFHLIEPEDSADWVNDYLIYIYNYDKESFYVYVANYLADIEIIDGKPYFVSSDREDLAEIFCDNSRRQSSKDIAERILDDDGDYFEPYDNTTDDVFNDVIKELTPKNLQRLKDIIVFKLKDANVDAGTELLENIAQDQNHPEYAIINHSNIDLVIDNEETMNYLFIYLDELKSELYSVHHNAYNTAYNDMLWEEVWGELQRYFIGQGEFIQRSAGYSRDPEKKQELFKIEPRDFDSHILTYLEDNKKYGSHGTLYYGGNYMYVLKETDCLDLRFDDYPDYRLVDKYINEYFNDYL